MNRLVEDLDRACPGYVPRPNFIDLQYSWMGGFVRHVIRVRMAGGEEQVRSVLAVIEREIASKGANAELAIVGFLEDLQNGNLHPDGSSPADFVQYLGAESARSWAALNGFWGAVEHSKTP